MRQGVRPTTWEADPQGTAGVAGGPPSTRQRTAAAPSASGSSQHPTGAPDRDHPTTNGGATAAGPLQTALLLVLLLPVVAAIYYPFRRRSCAAVPPAPPPEASSSAAPARPHGQPPLDPFAFGVVGLAGRGAIATARALALAALGGSVSSLVVIPRPDATRLFGLDEDEFLDEYLTELFIPGNLDAALAFLETELTVRKRMGTAPAPRLLLIADCAEEVDRIRTLLARHPGDVSALLMGPWTGDRATVEGDGRVSAPPTMEADLPDRLPTISGMEARNRLHAAIALPPQVRRRPSRRSTTRRT